MAIRDWRWWVFVGCLLCGFCGMLGAGFFLGQWGMSVERDHWATERAGWALERKTLLARFPVVRAEERAACTREFTARLDGMNQLNQQQAQSLVDLKKQMDQTNEVVAYTLRFLGDRARMNDARSATMLKQTREAAAAATAAQKTTVQVEQKVNAAAVKADEAASTAKAVDRKLDSATRPALPAHPWIGGAR